MSHSAAPLRDPFFLDAEGLQALASRPIVQRGIAYFREGRVGDLGWDDGRVWAAVEGSRTAAYQVEIGLDEDGELALDCTCPFDWEPACKHAVATLLAYGARQPLSEHQVEDAAGAAVAERSQRGRAEVAVRHVEGDRWLGTWEARSLTAEAQRRPPWRVDLRSVGGRLNHCGCPDFATNRLGTCKHVEAVLHRLRQSAPKKFERLAAMGPTRDVVHLDWEGPEAQRIRLSPAAGGAAAWLGEHFDDRGVLEGSLPAAYERLQRAATGRHDVVLAPEVGEHVRRLADEERRRERTGLLAEAIRAAGSEQAGVAAHLYPYQVEGVAFLAAAGRALLADDMGLGKTLQAIAAAAVLREHEGVQRALVVSPASLKHQWAREVDRFTGIPGVVVEGPPAARLALYRRRAPFSMINYELVLRDAGRIQSELAPDLLILDEAQRIKNWRTKTAAAVKALSTPFAFVLTGTPLENRLEDLYSLMQVVDPRVLGPLWRYLLEFHVADSRGRVLGYRNLTELRRRLAPVMLRRDRTLVRDQLPDRIDNRLDVELERRQRDLHDEGLAAAAHIARRAEKRPLTPTEERKLLAALQRARMACDAAGLVDGETAGSPKLRELATLLEELCIDGGRKAVVFSEWERMGQMAEEVARGLGLGVLRLHGGVPTSRRGALLDRFREDPAMQILISTDAGGVGLNLQTASVLINLDLPWNPAVLEQRIARVHRLGQAEPVQVVLMVARDSYEARIAGLLAAKKELFRNVITEEATEDAVGVSRRMVEMALESLGEGLGGGPDRPHEMPESDSLPGASEPEAEPAPGEAAPSEPGPEVDTDTDTGPGPAAPTDESLAALVASLQSALGDRIERVAALEGGLVVVTRGPDASAEELARRVGGDVPVAVIDSRAWASLSRLGSGSPLASARPLLEARPPEAAVSIAERKLAAAQLLADQGLGDEALPLAAAAMLHAAAAAAGLDAPPSPDRAALWLHAELLPRGVVAPADASSMSRALALAGATQAPPALVAEVLVDAGRLVRELGVD